MSDKILTIEEAAKRLKVAPDIVGGLLESGELPGRQIGGEWRTTSRALLGYIDGISTQGGCCCIPVAADGSTAGVACCQPNDSGCC